LSRDPNTQRQQPKKEWRERFGRRLRDQARKLGLTGAEVARRAGIEPKTFNNYVNGIRLPAADELPGIAAALNLSVDELLGLELKSSNYDPDTYHGLHRINNAAHGLIPADLDFIADVALAVSRRRHMEGASTRPERPSLGRLALAYERFLPAIVRKHAPMEIETLLMHADDEYDWLIVSLVFPRGHDRQSLVKALRELAIERLQVHDPELDASASREHQGVVIILRLRLGRTVSRLVIR
jgi:transcriptional regulator with XRE-family HTH domain